MTPDQLNRITASVLDDLETKAVEPLAKSYRKLIRRSGRHMARRMRNLTVRRVIV